MVLIFYLQEMSKRQLINQIDKIYTMKSQTYTSHIA